jgi:Protein of unknown function (DUF2924)
MSLNVDKEVALLQRMTVGQLREKFEETWGEPTNTRNKQWLVKRIAWQMQALVEGDISERARKRAAELAIGTDIRVSSPKAKKSGNGPHERTISEMLAVSSDDRLPLPGAILMREYKGHNLQVRVLPHGFEFEGEVYKSLSAVAKKISGQHCNGYHFFRLCKQGNAK